MAVHTRIFTNHVVTRPGAQFQASLMLDDAGAGNITLSSPDGPVLTIDATQINALIGVLQESAQVRKMMMQTGAQILVGDTDTDRS